MSHINMQDTCLLNAHVDLHYNTLMRLHFIILFLHCKDKQAHIMYYKKLYFL